MERALLERVKDGVFLGEYGASSVSRADPMRAADPWAQARQLHLGAGGSRGDHPGLSVGLDGSIELNGARRPKEPWS
jgi:hypothetical protein